MFGIYLPDQAASRGGKTGIKTRNHSETDTRRRYEGCNVTMKRGKLITFRRFVKERCLFVKQGNNNRFAQGSGEV